MQSKIWASGADEDYATVTAVSGEPVITSMSLEGAASPEELKKLGFRPQPGNVSAYGLWQLQKRKLDLREKYLQHWNGTAKSSGTGRPVDAIISPCAPYAAPPHGLNRCVVSNRYT